MGLQHRKIEEYNIKKRKIPRNYLKVTSKKRFCAICFLYVLNPVILVKNIIKEFILAPCITFINSQILRRPVISVI